MKQAVRTKWQKAQDMLQSVYWDCWNKIKSNVQREEKKNPRNSLQTIQTPTFRHPSSGRFADLRSWSPLTKPGWCAPDRHLPDQIGLCWSAPRELSNPLLWSLCSIPLFILMKTSASTEMWRWAWRHESPISHMASIWINHFTSASASWVLVFIAASSPTWIWLPWRLIGGDQRCC